VKGCIVSSLRSIGPIAGVPLVFFDFGETLTVVQLIGVGIVVATSATVARKHLKKENKKM